MHKFFRGNIKNDFMQIGEPGSMILWYKCIGYKGITWRGVFVWHYWWCIKRNLNFISADVRWPSGSYGIQNTDHVEPRSILRRSHLRRQDWRKDNWSWSAPGHEFEWSLPSGERKDSDTALPRSSFVTNVLEVDTGLILFETKNMSTHCAKNQQKRVQF